MYPHLLAHSKAFTLIEIVTVIMLISIVLGVALPAIGNMFSSQAVSFEASNFVETIRQGRYRAMETQAVHRLIFSDDWTAYKLETDTCQDSDTPTTETDTDSTEDNNYETPSHPDRWQSVLDSDEYEINPDVDFIRTADTPKCIFFMPDGTIVTRLDTTKLVSESNSYPLGETKISFIYGESAITILYGYLGVISSGAYHADDDEDLTNDNVDW